VPVKRRLKLIVLGALKMVGMFRLARWLTRRRLRILCYHAISVGDQHQYGPILFMRESVFASRVRLLERMRVRVVSLDDAVKSLQAGTISRAETVITIDDGWATTYTVAAPILKRAGFPATLYVASRYVENPLDVYAVTVIPLILPVDWILGRLRACTNVISDMTVAILLDRLHPNAPVPAELPEEVCAETLP